jgi:hypothetical protein
MSLNQELKSPRVFAISPRYLLIAGLFAAAILVAGCKSAAPETPTEYRGAPAPEVWGMIRDLGFTIEVDYQGVQPAEILGVRS